MGEIQVGGQTPGRLDWLDYSRLVCALWIMLAHFMVVLVHPVVSPGLSDYGLASVVARYGAIALFFFLMMSGMVITMIAERESAATFVARRFARVYPTFFLIMTATVAIAAWGPERFHIGLPQYLANLAINAPFFGQRYVSPVYWTLVVEVCFYLAVLCVIVTGAIRRLQAVVTVWVLLQVVAIPLPWRIPLISLDYYFLAAGAVFALLYQRRNERLNLVLLAVMLPLCIRCMVHYAERYQINPVIAAIATALFFGLFLFMRGRNPRLPAARRIGSMTYPLYLLHFHVGLIVFHYWIDESNKWAMVAGTSLFLIAISFAIDDIVEFRLRPFWVKLGSHTVARPFAWWERYVASRSHADSPASPALENGEARAPTGR
jgi:peptidoglycan/LPS O-acetylase OafA/YrhL